METTVLAVFIFALVTALATGLGAIPLIFSHVIPERWLGYGDALAGGLMLAASFNLIFEGIDYGLYKTMGGVLLGLVFIVLAHRYLNHSPQKEIGNLRGAGALKALMIVGVMTLHSFAEGVGVGVSFGGGQSFGAFITTAIAIHNIPEGLAISLVLVPQGISVWKAGFWSVVSSIPQPLMAVPAFLFVSLFRPFLPVGLGLAGGAMIWMVFSEIIPESIQKLGKERMATAVTLSIALMIIFQVLLGA